MLLAETGTLPPHSHPNPTLLAVDVLPSFLHLTSSSQPLLLLTC